MNPSVSLHPLETSKTVRSITFDKSLYLQSVNDRRPDSAENPPFILRETSGRTVCSVEIIGDFPFMLSIVEAFLGFSAESPEI
jgi:hypothetical protein